MPDPIAAILKAAALCGLILLVGAVFIAVRTAALRRRAQRRERVASGLECRCGYDLAGLDDGLPCPECGAER